MSALESLRAGVRAAVDSVRGTGGQALASQALAETTPALYEGYFYAKNSLELYGKNVTYAQMYGAQPAVATLVDKRANALARLSLNIWNISSPTSKAQETATPLARLLADPTGGIMHPFAFWRWMSSTYDLYGEVFALKIRDDDGQVARLVPMIPTRLMATRTVDGIVKYVFTMGVGSAGLLEVPAQDVLAQLRYNPDTTMRGLSRLEPLRETLANEDAARRANGSFWQRGARPGTVVTHPTTLSDNALKRLAAQFNSRYGGADQMGSTAVLDEGMTVARMQLDLEEMQYVESRKLNTVEACMVYDVPPPVVHILDHATFSNITEQMRSMYRDTMAPHLEDFESLLNAALVAEFYPDGSRVVKFDLDEVLRGDFETRATAAVSLVTNGIMKPSEARGLFDLPEAGEVADQLFGNQALQPLGTPVANAEPTPDPQDAPDEPVADPQHAPLTDAEKALPAAKASSGLSRRAVSTSGRIRTKATRSAAIVEASNAIRKPVAKVMQDQADAISGAWDSYGDLDEEADAGDVTFDLFDPEDWADEMEEALDEPTRATVDAFGRRVAGAAWDAARTDAWVKASIAGTAAALNGSTASRLGSAVASALEADDPKSALTDGIASLVDYMTGARLDQLADTRANSLAGFGEHEGAAQKGAGSKTWVVNAPNPRASHAALDGESVGLDETFSNGMAYPGDESADADETAGCTCSLDFTFDDSNDSEDDDS